MINKQYGLTVKGLKNYEKIVDKVYNNFELDKQELILLFIGIKSIKLHPYTSTLKLLKWMKARKYLESEFGKEMLNNGL